MRVYYDAPLCCNRVEYSLFPFCGIQDWAQSLVYARAVLTTELYPTAPGRGARGRGGVVCLFYFETVPLSCSDWP